MSFFVTVRTTVLLLLLALGSAASADEWSDAGFTALHRVVWQGAGFTLREAKRWKSRCGISDPAQVTEWEAIGLTTPTAVGIWIDKGYATPDAVVRFRNGEPAVAATPRSQPESKGAETLSRISSERKKREWLKKSQIKDLVALGIEQQQAELWIYAGYSSDETRSWLKIKGIKLPDDLIPWVDIGIDSAESLQAWQARGVMTPDAVHKQMLYERGEQEKFKQLGIGPEMVAQWQAIGATTFNQVNYLVKKGYSVDELRQWMAAGYITLEGIEAWRATGLSSAESKQWRDAGFNAKEVIQLIANRFTLSEIVAWQGVFGPYTDAMTAIIGWRMAGFTPATAGLWVRAHPWLDGATAASWRDSGYQPESQWVLQDISPQVVERWEHKGQTPAQIVLWIKNGFDPATAQQWLDRGLDLHQAKLWRDHDYSPAAANVWISQGVDSPDRAARLRQITVDVSDYFNKGLSYISFRKTAKLLDIHKLPDKVIARMGPQDRSVSHFDTLTPFAKCLTAYANKTKLPESAVTEIEHSNFYQIKMKQNEASKFMQSHQNSCEDWTIYIFTLWFKGLD